DIAKRSLGNDHLCTRLKEFGLLITTNGIADLHIKQMNFVITRFGSFRTDTQTDSTHPAILKDRKSTRLNSSHVKISYAVFCLKKKKKTKTTQLQPSHILKLNNQRHWKST